MKKILLVLLLPVLVFSTQQSVTTFTGGTFGATDTVIASGNFTIDTSVSIGAFWLPAGTTYTLTVSGTRTITLNNAGIAWKDSSTGTKTYPRITLSGNAALMRISSGSGAIAATSSIVTVNGTNDTITDKKIATFNQLVLSAGATCCLAGISYFRAANNPLTMGNNSTLWINDNNLFQINATGNFASIGTGCTIAGSGEIDLYVYAATITASLPAFTYTGTGTIRIDAVISTSSKTQLTGNLNIGTNLLLLTNQLGAGSAFMFDANDYNIICGQVRPGGNAANSNMTIYWGNGSHTVTSFRGDLANAGASIKQYMEGAKFLCTGNWTNGTNHTVYAGTSRIVMCPTTTSTYLSHSGKWLYDIVDSAVNFWHLILSDSSLDSGSLIVKDGANLDFNQKNAYVGLDYQNLTTHISDSVWRTNSKLFIGRDFYRASGGTAIRGTSCIYFRNLGGGYSHQATLNTNSGVCWYLQDAKARPLTLLDSAYIHNFYADSGLLATGASLKDSNFTAAACSLYIHGPMWQIIKNLSFTMQTKTNVTAPLYFIGGVSSVWNDSGRTVGDVSVSKTGAGIGLTIAGGGTVGDLTAADGNLTIPAGDTVRAGDGTFNNSGDTVSIGAGGALILSGNFSTAGDVVFAGTGKIVMTGASKTVTLNGNDAAPIFQADASTYINAGGSARLGGLVFGNDKIGISVRAGDTLVLAALAGADWSGSAGNLDSLFSATVGSRFFVSWPGNLSVSYAYLRDVCFSPGALTCPWTSGCRSGGGNRCP